VSNMAIMDITDIEPLLMAVNELLHESFHKDKPQKFTRKWFSWANTLFAELIIKYLSEGGEI
ncbi:MAG: glycoside hydrolase family 125 protein, partial [Clostridia bacterium]|nr:glycoside hydrolase family 125 protein [Clostridia bacterium]